MPTDTPHRMWVAQCEATATIKTRYGVSSAFDYLVAEKLMNFAEAARQHPEFARELPQFVAEVSRIFTPSELADQFIKLERMQEMQLVDAEAESDDVLGESPAMLHDQKQRLKVIKDLLVASQLGTS